MDKMVEILKKDGIGSALVSAGGSSIYCLGTPPGEAGWRIQIKDSGEEFQAADEVTLKDDSVIAPHTLDSEVWAKPYFIPGRQWTAAHKPANFRVFYCDQRNLRKDKADQQCAWLQ